MTHRLKTWEQYLFEIVQGKKLFEVRKNDRNFKDGDTLHLCGYNPHTESYTGKVILCEVTYILHGGQFGIEEGYCVMGIKVLFYTF